MKNHYHILLEITRENLSKFMRQLNMNYAIYFNKKYKRVGHLWQGRFKSWYVTDEQTVSKVWKHTPIVHITAFWKMQYLNVYNNHG